MIPKVIHYCWFGRKTLPPLAIKCIESWKKFFPNFEIKEWNEDNFDVNSIVYTSQAYQVGKYAFVSDYARFKILYENGGLYFDTDVEIIKSFDDILEKGAFMGCEMKAPLAGVNPGLGLGVEKENPVYKEILDFYTNLHFLNSDGSYNETTIVTYTTGILKKHGLKNFNGIQNIVGIFIYPHEYFNPLNDLTGKLNITSDTHSIHWFAKTWVNVPKYRIVLSRLSHRLFGLKFSEKIRKTLKIR